jgi:light-regulated signal transduction histidine kinase (bacteriophytochrome)
MAWVFGDFCPALTLKNRSIASEQDHILQIRSCLNVIPKQGKARHSGLGLAIAKWLTELHSGQLAIEATPDGYTKVQMTIPIVNGNRVV